MSKKCKRCVKSCKKSANCMLFTVLMKKTRRYIYILLAFITFILWVSLPSKSETNDFSEVVKVSLRDIGNKLLLSNNDSTSLILPVKALSNKTYQIAFNSELAFQPEDLVAITEQSLKTSKLPNNYRVEVLQCSDGEVAYSYEIKVNEEETIIPCQNRTLPTNCYLISVKFLNLHQATFNKHWLLLIVLVFLSLPLVEFIRNRSNSEQQLKASTETYPIGSYEFYPEQNKLVKSATEISLSKKECELLEIFVSKKNQIIKRDELTKRVWEDNGVIVGRSLDTYISKLRKKLKDDASVKLTNVHGVGYKLEIIN